MKYGYDQYAKSVMAENYEWHCAIPDCVMHSHDRDDFGTCEACHQPVCMEHARYAAGDPIHRFCQECFVCSTCGENATVSCEECGQLLCNEHAVKVAEPVDEWNLGDEHYYCRGVCQSAQKKPPMEQGLLEKREAI